MKLYKFALWILLILLIIPNSGLAQEDSDLTCPEIVELALNFTDETCQATGRNQACYGHILIDASPKEGIEYFTFDEEGDIIDLVDIRSFHLSPMDLDTGFWGVSLMELQANLAAETSAENVTLIVFGDVEMEDTAPPTTVSNLNITVENRVNVRRFPSMDSFVLGAIEPNETVIATGRLEDTSWIRVIFPLTGQTGWVYNSLLAGAEEGDIEALTAVEPEDLFYAPFQAFYFRSGIDDALCPQAPESGLLIQTPEGMAQIRFLINGVSVEMASSTAFFQAKPGDSLTVDALSGSVKVQVGSATQQVPAGSQVAIPLDEAGLPAGSPGWPEPYSESKVSGLPLDSLGEKLEVLPPLTEAEIYDRLKSTVVVPGSTGTDGTSSASSSSPSSTTSDEDGPPPWANGGDELPPGLEDNPGQGVDIPPGQQGTTLPEAEEVAAEETTNQPPGLVDNPALGDDGPPGLNDNPALGDDGPPGLGNNSIMINQSGEIWPV